MTQSSFATAIEPMFITGRFSDPNESLENVYELINGFWKAVEKVWPEAVANPDQYMIQRMSGVYPLNRLMSRIFSTINTQASEEEIEKLLFQIRENLGVDDLAWGRSAGLIRNIRAAYSSNRGHVAVTDYLWNGLDRR